VCWLLHRSSPFLRPNRIPIRIPIWTHSRGQVSGAVGRRCARAGRAIGIGSRRVSLGRRRLSQFSGGIPQRLRCAPFRGGRIRKFQLNPLACALKNVLYDPCPNQLFRLGQFGQHPRTPTGPFRQSSTGNLHETSAFRAFQLRGMCRDLLSSNLDSTRTPHQPVFGQPSGVQWNQQLIPSKVHFAGLIWTAVVPYHGQS